MQIGLESTYSNKIVIGKKVYPQLDHVTAVEIVSAWNAPWDRLKEILPEDLSGFDYEFEPVIRELHEVIYGCG